MPPIAPMLLWSLPEVGTWTHLMLLTLPYSTIYVRFREMTDCMKSSNDHALISAATEPTQIIDTQSGVLSSLVDFDKDSVNDWPTGAVAREKRTVQ
ncbi:hypothetical protein GGR50DRAFT_169591 [Xylaria sp. CBS 124048]|nr:hypothetical protein GGR50DRAFT_169591 [Xylaria sp. CBS 124048]